MPEHILSLSYGKDSLACLGAIEQLGWSLDRIVHAEVWATDTIPADLPPMVEFKAKADKIIKQRRALRWSISGDALHTNKRFTGCSAVKNAQERYTDGRYQKGLGATATLRCRRWINWNVETTLSMLE